MAWRSNAFFAVTAAASIYVLSPVQETSPETSNKTEAKLGSVAVCSAAPNLRPLPLDTSSSTPPEIADQNARNNKYLEKVLLPAIRRNGHVRLVQPNHTEHDPVNAPGQFIATKNEVSGIQFTVNVVEGMPSITNIQVAVFGKLALLGDGDCYGAAAYSTLLGHTESSLARGVDITNPEQGIEFVDLALDTCCATGTNAAHVSSFAGFENELMAAGLSS